MSLVDSAYRYLVFNLCISQATFLICFKCEIFATKRIFSSVFYIHFVILKVEWMEKA